jgi:hypothetical protein
VVITLPDVTKPVVTAFSIPSTSTSLLVPVTSFTASDDKAVTGYLLTESSTTPLAGNTGWTAAAPTSYTFASEGTKTLYAWAKDAAGNVSASISGQVAITLPDVTKPVVTAFSIPSTSTSLLVSVTSFTASDDKAVTGYILTESSTTPLAGNTGWTSSAPTSYSFATEGTKTLYAWAKDAAGNVSASMSGQVVITLPDVTKPVVTAFAIPSTSTSLLVPVTSFTASDDKAVTGYLLTESSTTPLAGNTGWTSSAPTSYSFATEGTKTLYAWAKDAAGNISASMSGQVVITLPDVTKPVVTAFSIPSTSTSLLVSVISFTASDDKAVTGYLLTESSTTPLAGNAGWTTSAPTSYSFATEGTKTLYAWAKDAAGNVSASISGQVAITLPDVTKPVVTAFSIPSTSTSLLVPVTSFTASDNKAVTGYLITESSTAPLAGNAGWTNSAPTSYSFASEGTKTLYAWAKDAAGNVSASISGQVAITLPDVTKPVVTAFSIPSTSTSLLVPVTSFTASDNKAVTGYLLTESSTTPLAENTGWTSSAPTSYSFATEGTKTLYAWAKDAAGNVTASMSGQVVITLPDVTKPVVTAFSIPSTSTSLLVSLISFTASDNKAVTGYLITESSTTPLAGNAGWTTSAPTSYSFATEGTKTLYAWAKDAAGNVSSSMSAQVVITLPDVTKPVVTAFSIPSTSTSLLVPVTSFTASDNKGVSGYLITESSTAPLAGNAGWVSSAPTSYSFATEGTKTLYSWAKDEAGNVSASMSAQVVITLPDVTKPVVTAFSIPSTSTSLLVSVTSFTASDNKAVTGYLLTETSTTPLAGNAGWTTSAPTSYSFATEGTKTLYAWAKDAAGNVSASMSAQVVITLPDVTKPVVTAFYIPSTSTSLLVSVTSFTASDDKAVTGYLVTESSTTPLAGNAGWVSSAPTSYSFANEGTKTLYAWAKDATGNVSASMSAQVVITLPDVTKPVVTAFSIPSTSTSLLVPVTSFTASDNKAVTGYLITESSTTPLAGNAGWTTSAPTSYSFANEGTKTLYAWAKDAAGNVSASMSAQVTIELIRPEIVEFSVPDTTESLTVPIIKFEVNDTNIVKGYIITETSSSPDINDTNWSSDAPTSYSFSENVTELKSANVNSGLYNNEILKTLYAWTKCAGGNISASVSAQVVIALPDEMKPVVTAFYIPSTSTSLLVSVTSFTASDNKAVTVYLLTESSTTPVAGNAGWTTSAPTSYSFATEGTKTLYAWAKDAAGNISASMSAQVVITLPIDNKEPDIVINEVPVQSIELRTGWNIFSSYLIPQNENMEAVMQTLVTAGKLIRVDDELGNTYLKQNNTLGWVNKIGNVQKTEGYKIRVVSDCTLEITGQPITLPLSIGIKKGTNIISFPFNGSVDAMEVIQPLIDAGILDKVQDERGNSIENWRKTGWKNGIGNFNGGEGYIIQALGSGVLTINEIVNKSGFLYAERFETSYFKVNYEGNGFDHMNINILDLDKTKLKIGDEIAAFDGKICVGAIKLTETDFVNNTVSLPASAAELTGVNGFTEENLIELKVWRNETNEEFRLSMEVTEGEMVFNKYSSVFVKINENQIVNGISDFDLLNISVYPNPANSVVNVSFSNLPEIGTEIIIMDINGREIIRRTVENRNESMKIQHLPGGMYLVKIQLNNHFKIQKLIKN